MLAFERPEAQGEYLLSTLPEKSFPRVSHTLSLLLDLVSGWWAWEGKRKQSVT